MSTQLQPVRRALPGPVVIALLVVLVPVVLALALVTPGSVGLRVVLACAIPVVTGLAVLASEAAWATVSPRDVPRRTR